MRLAVNRGKQRFGRVRRYSEDMGKIVAGPQRDNAQRRAGLWRHLHQAVDHLVDSAIPTDSHDQIIALLASLAGQLGGMTGVFRSGPVRIVINHQHPQICGLLQGASMICDRIQNELDFIGHSEFLRGWIIAAKNIITAGWDGCRLGCSGAWPAFPGKMQFAGAVKCFQKGTAGVFLGLVKCLIGGT